VRSRVSQPSTVVSDEQGGIVRWPLVASGPDSQLALSWVAAEAGATLHIPRCDDDTLVFAKNGTATAIRDGGESLLRAGSAVLFPAGESARLDGGPEGFEAVVATIGQDCDLHAPMGPVSPIELLDAIEPGKATGARSFQVLYDAANGSTRATLFVGHIPPGRAPWHYHLYDEIVWVLAGEGRLHLAGGVEPLAPGCTFRLHPRELHIVENASADRELSVLGLFTPAGSPSAAYLEPAVFAEYVASR
jgi:quercetin dioxygenase-like cupin family protein